MVSSFLSLGKRRCLLDCPLPCMRLSDSSEEDVQYRASWQGENDKVFPEEKKRQREEDAQSSFYFPWSMAANLCSWPVHCI